MPAHSIIPVVEGAYPFMTQELLPLVWQKLLPPAAAVANTLYFIARRRMLTKQFDWLAGQPEAYLVSNEYTFDPTHETLADLPTSVRLSHAPILMRSVNAHGWACSIAVEFVDVPPPADEEIQAAAVVFAEGSEETSKLVICFNSVFELPFSPDGRSWFFYPSVAEAGDVVASGGWWSP